jgi:hypothetical protein
MRVNAENHYTGCDNDGIVVEGRSRWEGEVIHDFLAQLVDPSARLHGSHLQCALS